MQEEVFGGGFAQEMADALLRRLGFGDGMELWVAEADGEIVSSGRLEPVPATEFAGIWGGAARRNSVGAGSTARSRRPMRDQRVAAGRLIHSDSTEESRPILEQGGTSQGLDDDALPVGRRRVGGSGDAPAASHWPAFEMSPDRDRRGNLTRGWLGCVALNQFRESGLVADRVEVAVPGNEVNGTIPCGQSRAGDA